MDDIVKKYAVLTAELKCVNCLLRELNAYLKIHPYSFLAQQYIDEANQIKRETIADIDSLANQVPITLAI